MNSKIEVERQLVNGSENGGVRTSEKLFFPKNKDTNKNCQKQTVSELKMLTKREHLFTKNGRIPAQCTFWNFDLPHYYPVAPATQQP